MGHRLLRFALLAAAATTLPAAAATAAPVRVDTLDLAGGARTVSAAAAAPRSCAARPLAATTPGVALRHVTATVDGFLDARLHGSPTGADWDLAVFDDATGRLVGASSAFGGNEVVQALVAAGTPLTVQACREDGGQAAAPLTVDEQVVSGDVPKPEVDSLIRIPLHSQAQADELVRAGIDTNETSRGPYVDAVAHGPGDLAELSRLGFAYSTRVPDLAQYDRTTLAADAAATPPAGSPAASLPSGRTTYRQLADYEQALKDLVAAHPGEVRPIVLPHESIEGRTVEGVEIASGVARKDDGRPVVLQLGLHHVREWPSGEMTIEAALDLFRSYGADDAARKQRLLDGERQIFVPVVNPDGLVATQLTGVDDPLQDDPNASLAASASGAGAYRRKNCSNGVDDTVPLNAPCAMQPGVDLNRNYGAFWGGPGESDSLSGQDYRGPAPFSEPESQNIHDLSSRLQVMVVNSNHTFAGDVLYQPGFHRSDEPGLKTTDKVPYQDAMKALADRMAAAAGYLSEVSYDLYDVTGATEDWNYFAQGAFGYTTETSYDNFHPNYQDGVIDQYTGTVAGSLDKAAGRKPSDGLRESMLRTAEAGLDPALHSTLTGTAPAGRVLRLQKTFTTSTSYVETQTDGADLKGDALQVPEHLESTLTVPASGTYTWAVDPSTRPVALLAGKSEAWTMTCEDASGKVLETRTVTIAIGQRRDESFACGGGGAPGGSGTGTGSDAPTTSPGNGPALAPTARATHRLLVSRPAFSAKRARRLRAVRVRLHLVGAGSVTGVRVRIVDARGRTLLSGRAARVSGLRYLTLRPTAAGRRALRPGRATVRVTAIDGSVTRTLTRTTRIRP